MVSLAQWIEANPTATVKTLGTGAVHVFTTNPTIWHLSDYHVSSAVSGPAVILVPKGPRCHQCGKTSRDGDNIEGIGWQCQSCTERNFERTLRQ